MSTIKATRNADGSYSVNTNASAQEKAAVIVKAAGKGTLVAAGAAAYVAASALATYGWSKLGEKIWDAL